MHHASSPKLMPKGTSRYYASFLIALGNVLFSKLNLIESFWNMFSNSFIPFLYNLSIFYFYFLGKPAEGECSSLSAFFNVSFSAFYS